ncbi:hypothetical protein [Deinococcus yunweiensis]|uniref:hypothetical protein n=1 Tax=Deinococcus yunweiensis TaxID=367282 RepID=UPI00398EF3C4
MTQAYVLVTERGNLKTVYQLPDTDAPIPEGDRVVLDAVKEKEVLLHIHGGLVPYEAAIDIARRLSRNGPPDEPSYPTDRAAVQLYLVWPADVQKALDDILKDSVLEKVVNVIVGWFSQQASVPGARGGVKGDEEPLDDATLEKYYENELKKTVPPAIRDDNALLTTPPSDTGERSFLGLSLAGIAVQATREIFKRRNTNPDGYLFEAVVREEVMNASGLGLAGRQIWTQIKTTATEHATGGFQTFLQQVYEACSNLTLVGHSTGANLITALLPALNVPAPDPKKLRVVFLAPAVTINTFNANNHAFREHLQSPLRIYTMATGVEIKDQIKWQQVTIYPGSLLQLVNFVFEPSPRTEHVLGLAHYALQQNFGGLVKIYTEHNCTSHGGFDDAQDILEQV